MKNILEIINLESSAENFIGDQMSYFQESGDYKVYLVCSDSERLEKYAKSQNVTYKAIPLKRELDIIQDIKSFFQICRYVHKNKIDIIICHQAKARTLAIPAAWLMGVKHRIIFSHGVLHETMNGLKRRLVLLNDQILGCLATNVICVSRHVMKMRQQDGIDNASKQVLIGHGSCNGIDVEHNFNPDLVSQDALLSLRSKYAICPDEFVIGFCGRLVKDKGVIELAEAFEQLKKRNPEKKFKLLIIGEPEKRDAVPENVLNTLYDEKDVVFTGRIEYANMKNYYCLMDILVFPSHRDGLGLAPLEAQAMKVPAVVSDVTGCRETIENNRTGLHIQLNAESICKAIEFFFDVRKRKEYGENGRKFVTENFNHNVYKRQLLDFLNTLV